MPTYYNIFYVKIVEFRFGICYFDIFQTQNECNFPKDTHDTILVFAVAFSVNLSTPRNQRSRNIDKCIKKPIWITKQWVRWQSWWAHYYTGQNLIGQQQDLFWTFVCLPRSCGVVAGRKSRYQLVLSVLLLPVGGGEDDIDTKFR